VRGKADENIPTRVVRLLHQHGHDVTTVLDEDLVGASDRSLAEAAAAEDRMLITLDRGFGDVRLHPPGTHPGILVLHPREARPDAILTLMESFLSEHDLEAFARCNVVVEPEAVRIRRPGTP
jgi:predicted nuclease of predicted toxin-antitoxin system